MTTLCESCSTVAREAAGESLGEYEVTPLLERAILLNQRYAQALGWQPHFDRIVRLIGFSGFTPDAVTFAQTLSEWQRHQGLPPDGILGPSTWTRIRSMLGVLPSPVVNTALSDSGAGYYTIAAPHRRFGLPQTIQALQYVAAADRQASPYGPRIGFGDISFQGGGSMPPHKSHQRGLDVDIRLPRNDGIEAATTFRSPTYSRVRTQEIVDRLHANPILRVQVILFNDPQVRGVRPWPGHDNHLHVSFHPPGQAATEWEAMAATGQLAYSTRFSLASAELAPEARGLYEIWQGGARTYVGEADNLRRRLMEHRWCLSHFKIPAGTYSVRYALMPRSTPRTRRAQEAAIKRAHPRAYGHQREHEGSYVGLAPWYAGGGTTRTFG